MAFFRRRNRADSYTIVDNFCLQDSNLSFAETGLMAYLLHLPADWQISQAQVEKAKIDGRDKVRSLFKSLINKGYLVKRIGRTKAGLFTTDYDVYERPTDLTSEPVEVIHNDVDRDGFTDTAQPSTVSRQLLNTNNKSFILNNIITKDDATAVAEKQNSNLKRSRLQLFEIVTKRYEQFLTLTLEPKRREILNDVINAMVDMLYSAEHSGFYKANYKQYDIKTIAGLLVKVDDENLASIVQSLFANDDPTAIRNRDRYIKACLLKQAETSKYKATSDEDLLNESKKYYGGKYVPNYLEMQG